MKWKGVFIGFGFVLVLMAAVMMADRMVPWWLSFLWFLGGVALFGAAYDVDEVEEK